MRKEIFIYKWLFNLLQGKSIILEGGEQSRDLTYITDTLDAWELTWNAPIDKIKGEKFQVSYGEELSLIELLNMCLDECGASSDLVVRKPYRPGEEGMRECFDISKARTVLGYNPKITPRELEEMVDMLRKWGENSPTVFDRPPFYKRAFKIGKKLKVI